MYPSYDYLHCRGPSFTWVTNYPSVFCRFHYGLPTYIIRRLCVKTTSLVFFWNWIDITIPENVSKPYTNCILLRANTLKWEGLSTRFCLSRTINKIELRDFDTKPSFFYNHNIVNITSLNYFVPMCYIKYIHRHCYINTIRRTHIFWCKKVQLQWQWLMHDSYQKTMINLV